MIVSHAHRLIFVHLRKCAGSSVTVSLARMLGPDDIMIGSYGDARAHGIDPPRRMLREAWAHPHLSAALKHLPRGRRWRFASSSVKRHYAKTLGPAPDHATAARIALAFPDEWRDYRSFAVIRDPWTRTVSEYHWRTRGMEAPPPFRAFLEALAAGDDLDGLVHPLHFSLPALSVDGEVAVTRLVRFERLADDLRDTMDAFGIAWDGWLPKAKQRTKGPRAVDLYGPEEMRLIERAYGEEIAAFGHAPPAGFPA